MWPDFTGVRYWTAELMQTSTSLKSDAFKNDVNWCFHTAVSFCCVCFVTEKKACNIYIYIHIYPNAAQVWCIFSEAPCVSSSLKLHPGELNYSLMLQRHAGQTAVLQALLLGHIRSNDYLTTKIFVDNLLLSTLSIMSTNHCSPKKYHSMFAESSISFTLFRQWVIRLGNVCSVSKCLFLFWSVWVVYCQFTQ